VEPMIQCDEVTKKYSGQDTFALNRITLDVEKTGVVTLLGRNGAGKTTFIRIAATQLAPTFGKMYVMGHDIMKEAKTIRDMVACVPQEGRPLRSLTPWDHVFLNLLMRGFSRGEARVRAKESLELLELGEFSNTSTEKLSGGLRRRILVAMAFASDSRILFLDEPTMGVDQAVKLKIWDAIRRRAKEGAGIILSTNSMEEAQALSDHIIVIDKGVKVAAGPPADLLRSVKATHRIEVSGEFDTSAFPGIVKTIAIGEVRRILATEDDAVKVAEEAVKRGIPVTVARANLEDYFAQVIDA
jgi:ABC-2 type transport system ATP-binding protein